MATTACICLKRKATSNPVPLIDLLSGPLLAEGGLQNGDQGTDSRLDGSSLWEGFMCGESQVASRGDRGMPCERPVAAEGAQDFGAVAEQARGGSGRDMAAVGV